MLKKPASKLGRLLFLLLVSYAGFTLLTLIGLLTIKCLPPIRATLWHLRHGNSVTYDGHLFHVPAYWYPDPKSGPRELTLTDAHFGSLGINHVEFEIAPYKLDGNSANQIFTKMAEAYRITQPYGSPDDSQAETLNGRSLEFHCMMSSTKGMMESLFCQAADSHLAINIIAIGRARNDALNILETSE